MLEDSLQALHREGPVLAEFPMLTWQQLHNRLQWGRETTRESVRRERTRRSGGHPPWLRTLIPFREPAALIAVLSGHSRPVNACGFAPDGSFLVSAGDDHTLRIWEPQGLERAVCEHNGAVRACAVAPDGSYIVSGGDDGMLWVWENDGRDRACNWWAHEGRSMTQCAVAPGGSYIVSCDSGGRLLFSEPDGQQRAAVDRGADAGFAMSPDGSYVVSAAMDGTVTKWTPDGEALTAFPAHAGPVSALAVDPGGSFIVSAGEDATLRVWDPDGRARAVCAHDGPVRCCAVAPDRSCIIAGGPDGLLRIWDPDGHEQGFWPTGSGVSHCVIAPDGSYLLSASNRDGAIRIWTPGGEPRAVYPGGDWVRTLAVAPDGSSILSASGDGMLRMWDPFVPERPAPPGEIPEAVVPEPSSQAGRDGEGVSWAIAPDGSFRAVANEDGSLRIEEPDGRERAACRGHDGPISCLAIAPDSSYVVSAGATDGTLRLWDADGRERATLRGHERAAQIESRALREGYDLGVIGPDHLYEETPIRIVCDVAPNSSYVVSGSEDRTLRVWDAATGDAVAMLPLPDPIVAVAVDPSAPRVACREPGGDVQLMELTGIAWNAGRHRLSREGRVHG
jgi:WD40 repeat protein